MPSLPSRNKILAIAAKKLTKCRYQTFLVFSNFTEFPYIPPNISGFISFIRNENNENLYQILSAFFLSSTQILTCYCYHFYHYYHYYYITIIIIIIISISTGIIITTIINVLIILFYYFYIIVNSHLISNFIIIKITFNFFNY